MSAKQNIVYRLKVLIYRFLVTYVHDDLKTAISANFSAIFFIVSNHENGSSFQIDIDRSGIKSK
jgi:hypothetical protein